MWGYSWASTEKLHSPWLVATKEHDALKCFAGLCFCPNQLYGPRLGAKMRREALRCFAGYSWRGSIVRPKTCYKKRDMMLDNVLLAVVLDQINCTAQDLMRIMRREALKMLCWLQFLSRSIVRPKTCYKKRDMMLDNALLAVVLDQINCTAQDLMQKWGARLSNALLATVSEQINCTAQDLLQKRDPAHGVKHSNEQYNWIWKEASPINLLFNSIVLFIGMFWRRWLWSHFCNKSWAVQLICSETVAGKAFESLASHFLHQVLGRTIDLIKNKQPVKHYRASCLVFCNKSWAVQLICSRLDQINCTAQDLMQKMRREALENA